MDEKHFDLLCEENHALDVLNLRWDGDSPPDLIWLPDGSFMMKIGRYLSEGDRYRYKKVQAHILADGVLKQE